MGFELLNMTTTGKILIGAEVAEHVSLKVVERAPDGWLEAEIEVHCDGWSGKMNANFFKGELSRFADEIWKLHRDLAGTARLEPREPNLILEMKGDGKGHISLNGVAQNTFGRDTRLTFQFEIDQTYLKGIADSLIEADQVNFPRNS